MFMTRGANGSIPGALNPPQGMAQMPVQLGGGFFDSIINAVGAAADGIPPWSLWPNMRDAYLATFWKSESILGGALYSMESKVSTLGFEFKGKHKNTKAYYQKLAGEAHDGIGLSQIFQLTVHSLLTCDNGAFWYLHGAGRSSAQLRGRVVDIRFLDSAQCWRTFDPDHPVCYFNPFTGTYHYLHKSRVVMMSSMMQPNELGRKVGFCVVSRVLEAARIMRDIRLFKSEKVGGRPSRGIFFVNGMNRKQMEQALSGAELEDDNVGYFRYKGVDVLAQLNKELKGELFNLANLPDGFNEKDDTQLYVNTVALASGTDSREFWPATTSGATKADADVSDRKSKGKGIGDILRTLRWAMNWRVLGKDSGTQFDFDDIDLDEMMSRATVNKTKADTYKVAVDMGAVIPEEARAMMINDGALDAAVLADLAASTNYDEASPVTDENEPETAEQSSIFDIPISDVETREHEQQQADMESKFESAESGQNGEESGNGGKNPFKPKQKAKRSDLTASGAFDAIDDDDINWALAKLGNML